MDYGREGFAEEEKEINGGKYSRKKKGANSFLNAISVHLHRRAHQFSQYLCHQFHFTVKHWSPQSLPGSDAAEAQKPHAADPHQPPQPICPRSAPTVNQQQAASLSAHPSPGLRHWTPPPGAMTTTRTTRDLALLGVDAKVEQTQGARDGDAFDVKSHQRTDAPEFHVGADAE
ncbi:hypothetical protein EYF80_039597 [Liparis tanakae]|uniref:Uncharacterized protein n=1 Tax=Liparis tanakae TaxID=230148 RepID=A0A4Z2GB79_9TELE|nr:hypothetical protein EYF80_039597 [Liparis tanakae]